jgi:hypothetical protein
VRILHLPNNIASQISICVRGLRTLGVEARGLARKTSVMHDYSGIQTVDWSERLIGTGRLLRGIRWRWKMIRAMNWADVVHWHWGESTWKGLDLRIAAWLKKPRIVEFWGSDLRDPALASKDNLYLARMFQQHPELARQQCSIAAQSAFSKYGFECLIPGHELSDYLNGKFFAGYYRTRACLVLDDFVPRFPEPTKRRPLVVHAPSNKLKKGTELVLETVRRLGKIYQFDFELIHQMPRQRALELVAQCDLFLDQFTIGAEGLAAYEAMAMGKPVICFIKPALLPRYASELPILVASQDTLQDVMAPLLIDGSRRHEIGKRSRKYVEDYHDARNVCSDLIEVYNELCSRRVPTLRTGLRTRVRFASVCSVEPLGG